MTKLSFVMPIYEPDLILFEKVLKALTVQSLKDWEAIFVLDGPNEGAQSIIERMMKKVPNHYKTIVLPHGGVQKARNAGTAAATGEYIVCFDCDCIIEVHTAKAWVDMLDQNKDVAFVYSGYQWIEKEKPYPSEPFDPWTLRVRNYISACFPVRRELAPKWDESLESLQDWDFWLTVVENGGKGMYLPGYAFATAYPTTKSISGKGCTNEKWLERMDRVKAKHNIPIKKVCVTSLYERFDAIALAKMIDANFEDNPNGWPNHYETIIQIGFSVKPGDFERCASVWGRQHKKVIFWTADDIETIFHGVSLSALLEYAPKINQLGKQFVEDKKSKEIMTKAGFNVEILPLPVNPGTDDKYPEEPKFLCDVTPEYGHVFNSIQRAIPDIKLEPVGSVQEISDYTGIVCFHKDGMTRQSVKRMLAAGRKVISNIQQPGMGYVNDVVTDGVFIKEFVDSIRTAAQEKVDCESVKYWTDKSRVNKVMEAIA